MNSLDSSASIPDRVIIERQRHSNPADELAELRRGLLRQPRELSSKHFYDSRGSELFERICDLPEYYQTRTEHALLEQHAENIVALAGARDLVEIGSGAATKTRALLRAMARQNTLSQYIPLDVDETMLERVAEELSAEIPGLSVHGIGGDFLHSLARLPPGSNRLFIFLGGTIGNLRPFDEAPDFLRAVREQMGEGDYFLLGTDLIKEVDRLEAAYNDSQGVTAEFNRNILRVVNRVAGADFDIDAFRHRAFWNPQEEWIEMRLVSIALQHVRLGALDLEITFAAEEEIRTEISAKYDRNKAEALLQSAGLDLVNWITDDERLFGLSLARVI